MISRKEKYCYAAGDWGFNLVWMSIELYLLFFYIQILHLPLPVASAIFLAGAVLDWVSDPLIGALADRFSDRVPLRAWVLICGPAMGAALVLAFSSPELSGLMLFVYVLITHLFLRFCYSIGNIPYAALTARMTDRADDHVALTGVRMQGAALGGISAAIIYNLIPASNNVDAGRFMMGAVILAFAAQPFLLATFLGVKEKIITAPDTEKFAPWQQIKDFVALLTQSAAMRRLMITIIFAGLSCTMLSKSLLFLFSEMGEGELGYRVALSPSLALLLTVPIWLVVEKKLGRVPTLLLSLFLNFSALILAWLALPHILATASFYLIAIIASCGMSIMFWSLVPAVIADVEAAHKIGCAARIYALTTTARKLGQALSPQVITLSLAYSPNASVMPGLVVAALMALLVTYFYRPIRQIRPK
ncbi:hypothetical protein LPB140_02495 [Sphingorhabdus lutea]|uniref:MFS transporter n=1 Tax=Sphingorhabdus lutea TaxID=1913578 RepID=A0A1L3J9U2_9SPHN|nr:MFS transporter [Sphingorhabdus lutea]APG61881.1 hypothetical protein LPB140_02495 [Sphingorhabdus lutea]